MLNKCIGDYAQIEKPMVSKLKSVFRPIVLQVQATANFGAFLNEFNQGCETVKWMSVARLG